MSKPVDPEIIFDVLAKHIQKITYLYGDKAPFVFFNHPSIYYTEEQKIAIAWRQGMIDALRLINREFIDSDVIYKRYLEIGMAQPITEETKELHNN